METLDVWCDVLLCFGISGVLSFLLHILILPVWVPLFLPIWTILAAICIIRPLFKVSPAHKTVLITGCDTGFGFDLALRLHSLGYRVVAGCLDVESEGSKLLQESTSSRLTCIQLDVTNKEQMKEAVEKVKSILEDGDVLWAVVNNAGISTFGEVEWVTEDTYRKIFEVNVVGTISTTKAFLPLIRRAKGRVVNIASVLGRMGNAMRSPYAISKYGVEGFSDCLRHEMIRWGVKVCIIEPGNYVAATDIITDDSIRKAGDSMWESMKDEVKNDYGQEYFEANIKKMFTFANYGEKDRTNVIDALTHAITEAYPRSRYLPMDVHTRFRIAVATIMPAWVYDFMYAPSTTQK